MIHDNSFEAWKDGWADGSFARRSERILRCLFYSKQPMTDRQIKDRLGLEDMNSVRPRITELIADGYVREVGDTICEHTHKPVRLVDLRQPTPDDQRMLF